MQNRLRNLKKIHTDSVAVGVWVVTFFIVWYIWRYFSNLDLTKGNMWARFAYFEIIVYWIFLIFFTIFVAASVYQRRFFKKINIKTSGAGGVWWIFGILVAWCPACSITLASYLWLASVMSLLPRNWLELKILWVIIVCYAAWKTVNGLETCSMSSHTKKRGFNLLSGIKSINFIKGISLVVIVAWIATFAWALYSVVVASFVETGTFTNKNNQGIIQVNSNKPVHHPWWCDGSCGR